MGEGFGPMTQLLMMSSHSTPVRPPLGPYELWHIIIVAVGIMLVMNLTTYLMNRRLVKISEAVAEVYYLSYSRTPNGDGMVHYSTIRHSDTNYFLDPGAKMEEEFRDLAHGEKVLARFHFTYHWGLICSIDVVLDSISVVH